MNREAMLAALDATRQWDVIIIGGGATGLGTAVEAASRGLKTLLLEQSDFAKGTSSRSTKLVHGGVRYLKQGNVSLVLDALRERGRLLDNAPHLVHPLPFVVPNYGWWGQAFYGLGLKAYDLLAMRSRFGRSELLSHARTRQLLPTVEPRRLVGGVLYYDGQFDDARLAISLAQTAAEQGATLLSYLPVVGLLKAGGRTVGVQARDAETSREYELQARAVINATGVFTDEVLQLDQPSAPRIVAPSQGAHLVLDRSFLPGEAALMVPRTDDGRVLFAIPWMGRTIVGTTDVPVEHASLEPRPLREEIEFLLDHAARYLVRDPLPSDVRSIYAGLRPLVKAGGEGQSTAALARDHTLLVSPSGLVTITGGKWTTYRQMAEQTVDRAAATAGLAPRPSATQTLRLHGYDDRAERHGALRCYGSDAPAVAALAEHDARLAEPLHAALPIRGAEVVWAARQEMARSVEDVLARRTRMLVLDARASVAAAPRVAELLAAELGRDANWQREQVAAFTALAEHYQIESVLG